MLTNYYLVDENQSVESFLKSKNEKKNIQYLVLETTPETFVDIRDLALKSKNFDEKLKNLKRILPQGKDLIKVKDKIEFLYNSGEKVCKFQDKFYDIFAALKQIHKQEPDFLKKSLSLTERKEVYALNLDDKISQARKLLIQNNINLLPVINQSQEVVGEIRTFDFLLGGLYDSKPIDKNLYSTKYEEPTANLTIEQIMNKKPLVLKISKKFRDALDLMIEKNIPSVILVDNDEKIYSIISYKEIIREYLDQDKEQEYTYDIIGSDNLYEDEKYLIENSIVKFLKKISKFSRYNDLKVDIKPIHSSKENDTGHVRKYEIKMNLCCLNEKPIHYEKKMDFQKKTAEHDINVKNNRNLVKLINEMLNSVEIQLKKDK